MLKPEFVEKTLRSMRSIGQSRIHGESVQIMFDHWQLIEQYDRPARETPSNLPRLECLGVLRNLRTVN